MGGRGFWLCRLVSMVDRLPSSMFEQVRMLRIAAGGGGERLALDGRFNGQNEVKGDEKCSKSGERIEGYMYEFGEHKAV